MENKIDIFDMLENISDEDLKTNNSNIVSYSFKYTPQNYITYKYLYKTKKSKEIINSSEKIALNTENKTKYETHSFKYKAKKEIKAIQALIGFVKYITTSATIFAILLLTANYSAYINIAKSYIYADQMKTEASSLLNSVEASKITQEIQKKKKIKHKINEEKIKSSKSKYSLKKITQNKKKPALNIEITPYENRIVIPKIAKNIPLIDIKQRSVS